MALLNYSSSRNLLQQGRQTAEKPTDPADARSAHRAYPILAPGPVRIQCRNSLKNRKMNRRIRPCSIAGTFAPQNKAAGDLAAELSAFPAFSLERFRLRHFPSVKSSRQGSNPGKNGLDCHGGLSREHRPAA
jgi:hypothetical protein